MKYKYWKIWHSFYTWHNDNASYIYFWLFVIINYLFLTHFLQLSTVVVNEISFYGMVTWCLGWLTGTYSSFVDEIKRINKMKNDHYDQINKIMEEQWKKKQ